MSPRPRKSTCEFSSASRFTTVIRKGGQIAATPQEFRLKFSAKDARQRIRFVLAMLCEFETSVAIRFADVEESQELNAHYRGKNSPTDVLSFSAWGSNRSLVRGGLVGPESERLGDLCICVPVCRLQAREHRSDLAQELERMIIHGLCHLRGLDHERSDAAHRVMSRLESALQRELVREHGRATWAQVVDLKE